MPLRLDSAAADFAARFAAFVAAKREAEADVQGAVAAIIADVRARGDAALIDLTRRFDRFDLARAGMRIGADAVAEARRACTPAQLDALAFAASRIRAFHAAQKPADLRHEDAAGVSLGWRWTAIDAVGIYVPGGTASYPSSVLMNALPAKVAGVGRIAMAVPAPEGCVNPLVLAAADIAGVDEIYRIGGAQAVAAFAYGTATIAAVDKIVGPGNAYVAEAKRQVFGQVGIDMIAGPSEILVVADAANDPAWIAADLLSQAEHDATAQAILLCDDTGFADAVCAAIARHLETLGRGTIAAASWQAHGAVVLVRDLMAESPALIDRLAPEHLALCVADPEALLARVRHAGSIFLGRYTPEAIGDYVGGPNHVLPTGRRARFSSGLSVTDFMKRSTLLACTPAALAVLGPSAVALAEAEGLDAHGLSVALRLKGD
ncbi:MAG: histidinol dehydrogenase [Alphaproteobacteria bacterium]|nr:MAG: histidinol dehydrogenase [Alphaproteobacteria bacterium]